MRRPALKTPRSLPAASLVQAEKERLEEEQRRLAQQLAAAEGHVAALHSSTEQLVAALEQAAEGRGRNDLPALVRQQLADWHARVSGAAPKAAAGAGGGDASGGDASSSSGGKIMI